MRILGIDPGLKGGLAIIGANGIVACHPMPLRNDAISVHDIDLLLQDDRPNIAYIENQWTQSGQAGNFTIGKNYGRILAVLELYDIEYVEVRPQQWQNRMLAEELYRCDGDTKKAAIMYCQNRGWEVPRRSKRKDSPYNDGVADALCIAAYGAELARIEAMMV